MSRLIKLDEIIELAILLQNSYQGLSIDDIAEYFETSNRSAERMKAVLTNKFPEKIQMVETNERKKRWKLKKNTINFLINFSKSDFALLDYLKNKCEDIQKQKELELIIEKMKSLCSNFKALDVDIDALIEAQGYAVRQYQKEKSNEEILQTIKEALLSFKKIKITYTTNEKKEIKTVVYPYGFLFAHINYLVAFSQAEQGIRNYKLSKISKIELLDDYFEMDKTFNLKAYCNRAFSTYFAEPLKVELLFANEVVETVLNYHFHPTQTIEKQTDGTVLVKFKASGDLEICYELFKWGHCVNILKPASLKKTYKKYLEDIIKTL